MEFNLADIHEAVSETCPDRECIVWRDRRLTYGEVTDRTRRLAGYLASRGLGVRAERSGLSGWQSGQSHVALYLYNCNEYIEGMLGAFKARVAPFNVNYRYVEEELLYLFRDAKTEACIYHAAMAPTLGKLLPELPELKVLLQVADESGNALLPGAVDYEEALASASAERPAAALSPDAKVTARSLNAVTAPRRIASGGSARRRAASKSSDASEREGVERWRDWPGTETS